MTVLEVITKSTDFLAKRGVEAPRLQTELLLAHVLQLPRMQIYLQFERRLTESELSRLRGLVQRRGQREPLQHLTGSTSFCGLEIAVNRSVLIPRPETELLAEAGWQFLCTRSCAAVSALDVGTGSGCIAIALAAKCATARIVATDISRDALELARLNAAKNQVRAAIEFRQGNGLEVLQPGEAFDLVISNPPYIPTQEIVTLQTEVREYDPHPALDGGADGLDFYRRLATQAGSFLHPDGRLMVEFGAGQAAALREIFSSQQWSIVAIHKDYSGHERILVADRGGSGPSEGIEVRD